MTVINNCFKLDDKSCRTIPAGNNMYVKHSMFFTDRGFTIVRGLCI